MTLTPPFWSMMFLSLSWRTTCVLQKNLGRLSHFGPLINVGHFWTIFITFDLRLVYFLWKWLKDYIFSNSCWYINIESRKYLRYYCVEPFNLSLWGQYLTFGDHTVKNMLKIPKYNGLICYRDHYNTWWYMYTVPRIQNIWRS